MPPFTPPALRLVVRARFYDYQWLWRVTGFRQARHCQACFQGGPLELLPASGAPPEGRLAFEARLTPASPFVYLCAGTAGNREYARHLHLLMEPDDTPNAGFVYQDEDDTYRVEVTGMKRIEILPVPGAEGLVPSEFRTCRNWQAGWLAFPGDRLPLDRVPGTHDAPLG